MFEGRVIAYASSETYTDCAEGWQQIDKPLELCSGKLSDTVGADGACFADYEAVPASQAVLAELEVQPWLKTCLATPP